MKVSERLTGLDGVSESSCTRFLTCLAWEERRRAERLFVTICRVSEPDIVVRVVDHDIVDTVELATVEVVQNHLRLAS